MVYYDHRLFRRTGYTCSAAGRLNVSQASFTSLAYLWYKISFIVSMYICYVDINELTYRGTKFVLHCTGEQEIPGLTDMTIPRRLGPKRASKIRKLFNLKKEDDVRQYVVRRPLAAKEGSLICGVCFQ